MSALSNLAGLSPPKGDQIWDKNLLWQPVPVHTVPIELDNLLGSHASCPKMQELIDDVMVSKEVEEINKKYDWMYKYITEHSGENVTDIIHVDYIYDTLYIEEVIGYTRFQS